MGANITDATSGLRNFLRRLLARPDALMLGKLAPYMFVGITEMAMILIAIFAPAVAPYDPAKQSLSMRNDPPMTRPAHAYTRAAGLSRLHGLGIRLLCKRYDQSSVTDKSTF